MEKPLSIQTTPPSRTSMREVAAAIGVAPSSVSRVLSDHPDVSPQMRERVLEGVRAFGYQRNMLAQGLRSGATLTIGFLVNDIANPVFAEMVKGAETRLREAGYSMLLTNSDGDPELDAAHIRLFAQRWVDGLILASATDLVGAAETHSAVAALSTLPDTPVVLVDRDVSPELDASRVLFDHFSGMAAAAEHLLELGHRRIALVIGHPMRPTNQRRRALEETFGAKGTTLEVLQGDYSAAFGAEATAELLGRPEPPTALIAGGNQLLVGALESIGASGLEIGRDLSLVGCDHVALAALYRPPIAIVDRDNRELGVTAADLLLERLQGDGQARDVVLPTTFVPRPSCAPPRDAGP
jgi:LacI family transcriptional regulator